MVARRNDVGRGVQGAVHIEALPGEKKDSFQTLGGFLFTHMGRVPSVSETFEWNSLRFEIADMDGKRIDKVLVSSR